jgi:PAS domain S-box-containing protein
MKPPAKALHTAKEPITKANKIAVIVSSCIIIFCALIVLVFWTVERDFLVDENEVLQLAAINPFTSFCILLVAILLLLFLFKPSLPWVRTSSSVIAIVLIIEGLARLLVAFGGYDLKLDMLFFRQKFVITDDGLIAGRTTYMTALVLVLLGISLLYKLRKKNSPYVYQFLLISIAVICLFNIISVIYGVDNSYFGPLAVYRMKVGGGICGALIVFSLLIMDRERGMMAIITNSGPGGRIATTFLPVVVIFPLLLGVIDRFAEMSGMFQDAFGLALFSIIVMIIFLVIIIRTARSNNNIYNQLVNEIKEREKAEEEVRRSARFAETIFENMPYMAFVKGGDDLHFLSMNKAGEVLTGLSRHMLIGKNDNDFFPKEQADFFRATDKKVFSSLVPVITEEPISTSNGERWLRTKKIAVRDEEGNPLYLVGISEDITELKEKQELLSRHYNDLERMVEERTKELRKSASILNAIIESAPDALVITDEEGRIKTVNTRAEKMFDYSKQELIGRQVEILFPERYEKFHQENRENYKRKKVTGITGTGKELVCRTKGGKEISVEISLSPIETEDQLMIAAAIRDISERKLAEEKLRESQQQFQAFMGTLPALAWMVDEAGIFHYCNPLYIRIFNQANLIGKSLYDIFPKDFADEYQRNNEIVFKSNIVLETIESTIKPDGSHATLKIFKFPLGSKGDKKLLGGIAVDITQLVETESALKRVNEQINLFVKHAPAAVAMFDDQMHYIMASDRWYQDYGLEGQEIIGKSHYEIFPEIAHSQGWKEIHRRCLNGAVEVREKDPFIRADGSLEWLRWEIHPWKTEANKINGIIMFTEVITERIRAEEAMTKLNEQLTTSNRELEQFAYVASHDLQEPLRMVSSFLQLLEKKYKDKIDSTASQYIHFAVDGSERMKILINDLLKFSRLGNNTEGQVMVDCNEVSKNVLNVYQQTIKNSNAVVRFSNMPVVRGQKTQIEQLFQNLIGNALKYRGSDPPVIDVGCREYANHYEFFVKDNGIGIDKKYFNKIFIIFQRLHGKNEFGGTGIGLAICKKIAELHGGKIWVESEPGKGSTFYFTLLKTNKIS